MTAKQTQLFLLQEQRRGRCYCPATGGHQEESLVAGAPPFGAPSSSFTKVLRAGSSAAIVRQRAMRANPYPMQSQQHQSTTPSGLQDHACLQSGGRVNKGGLVYQQNKLHQALRVAQQTTSYVMKPWGTSETVCSEASTTVPSTAQEDGTFTFSGSNALTTRCSSTFSSESGTTAGSCSMPYFVPAVTPVEGAKECEAWEQQQRQQQKSTMRENGCNRQAGKGATQSQCSATVVKLQNLSERETDSAASTAWPSSSASSPTASPASLLSASGQPEDPSQDRYGNDPHDPNRAVDNSNGTTTPAATPTTHLTPRATPATPISGLSQPVEDLVGSFHVAEDGYIVTPGQHRIHINNFLMEADLQAQGVLCGRQPAAAAMASYAQDIYSKWRLLESQIDRKTFQLSFNPESDLEKFRQMALLCILQYARDVDLSNSTTHCSIHNVHRVLLYYVYQMKVHLTANMFIGTIAACLRMALKHEEVPEKIRPFRESSGGIWKALGLTDPFVEGNTAYLNKVEVECLNILKDPLTPPSGPDYVDRYLTVGGWPSHLISSYREIALYLVNLSLFSRRGVDQLAGLPPSLLSASALALGIKIISAGKDDGYEFWPQRLVVYSGYGLDDLRPGVRGLSMLLRNKPPGCDILEHFHSFWAKFDWK